MIAPKSRGIALDRPPDGWPTTKRPTDVVAFRSCVFSTASPKTLAELATIAHHWGLPQPCDVTSLLLYVPPSRPPKKPETGLADSTG